MVQQTAAVADHRYRFRSTWRLTDPVEVVWDVLEAVPAYPSWWPQVRSVSIVELAAVRVTCRSALPYSLVFTSRPARREPSAGVLEARLDGDLEGWSRWTLIDDGSGGTVAVFDEEVVVNRPLLRAIEPVARPVLRLNHRWMMRGGRRGLAAFLAARRATG